MRCDPKGEERIMNPSVPEKMKAVAIDRFGGPEVLHTALLPVPEPGPEQVLVRLDVAGIGVWDPWVREGGLETKESGFPRVIGNDGAGVVVAVGADVTRFAVGDAVYAFSMDGGFYAEYVAVDADNVAPIPPGLRPDEAGALGADGITALRGLQDELRVETGQTLIVFGASGGIGHIAVQLAKRMGARVLAIASGADGVELVRSLGADASVDGRKDDVKQAAHAFAPKGVDAALVLVDGRGLSEALSAIKKGGRVAYPNGVDPTPDMPAGVEALTYEGTPDRAAFERLNALIGRDPFRVELGRTYRMDEASAAHREIERHHLGKLALRVRALS
jgi:NADPH:quinone reductase-like Zn-dependent oxidoreductase